MPKLSLCPHCKETSVVRRVYSPKSQPHFRRLALYCVNKGCGYRETWELPEVAKYEEFKKDITSNK